MAINWLKAQRKKKHSQGRLGKLKHGSAFTESRLIIPVLTKKIKAVTPSFLCRRKQAGRNACTPTKFIKSNGMNFTFEINPPGKPLQQCTQYHKASAKRRTLRSCRHAASQFHQRV